MAGRIPWRRVLAEGAVIVVSILLASSIDAWWARLGERRQERTALGRRTTWIAAARVEFTLLGQHLDDLIVPVAGGLP